VVGRDEIALRAGHAYADDLHERIVVSRSPVVVMRSFPKPTPGFEPGTPSLREPCLQGLLGQSCDLTRSQVLSHHLRFAEFGTYFGTDGSCDAHAA
jgi:hypothetical protein